MKIIHVVPTLDPAAGGPPQVAVRLAAAQAAQGHQVHLVFHSTAAEERRVEQQIASVPHRDRVIFHPLRNPDLIERAFSPRARRALSDLAAGAAFFHLHGVWSAILRTAASVARAKGVPYCFRPAGMLDPWSLGQKAWKKRLALALTYRSLLGGSSFIHTLNADEKRLIEPLRLNAPSVVLPNGVFVEEIEPLPPAGTFRSAHPSLGSAPFVLFLSRLHPKKGIDILADAFALLAGRDAQVALVVAGPDEGARHDLVARVTAAGLADRVHLVGPIYGRDKLAAFVDAACFCLPSRQEGFSVAITEAMACGVPVVISEACHFPDVAEAGAGTVVNLDPVAFAAALEAILADPARAASMGAAGAALVRRRFTWDTIARDTIGAYEDARSVAHPAVRTGSE